MINRRESWSVDDVCHIQALKRVDRFSGETIPLYTIQFRIDDAEATLYRHRLIGLLLEYLKALVEDDRLVVEITSNRTVAPVQFLDGLEILQFVAEALLYRKLGKVPTGEMDIGVGNRSSVTASSSTHLGTNYGYHRHIIGTDRTLPINGSWEIEPLGVKIVTTRSVRLPKGFGSEAGPIRLERDPDPRLPQKMIDLITCTESMHRLRGEDFDTRFLRMSFSAKPI